MDGDANHVLDALYHTAGPLQQIFCLMDTNSDGAPMLHQCWDICYRYL